MHRWTKEIERRRDLGTRWKARHQRIRSSRKEGRLHAAGNRPLRGIQHKGNHDILRMDIRNGYRRNHGKTSIPVEIPRSAQSESISEES